MTDTDTGTSALDPNPFEIIDSPWGHIERWRASTMSTGTMGALAQVYDIVRADADAAVARVEETKARKALVQHLCDQIAAMQRRINTLADALEARHKADAEREERERQFEEEPLSLPPGNTELELEREPDPPELTADDTLHELEGKGELPDPPLGAEADQVEFEQPGELEAQPPSASVVPQPIAVELD
jgi:hypothetical protein